jgi:CMP-N,N'-diacetyllegionaminic acid synthase
MKEVMQRKKEIIGIIPARGGSKGIPQKNIKLMNGKPLIAYTIESALESGVLDRLIVSTDSQEIAKISSRYNKVEVKIRPAEISTDDATTESALIHVCEELSISDNIEVMSVLTLEPTSPFRTKETIQKCVKLLSDPNVDSVVGVTEVTSVLGRIVGSEFKHIFPNQPRRRQDREGLYQESSTIYGTLYDVLKRKKSVLGDKVFPLVISSEEAVDINEPIDFKIAEFLMKCRSE